MNNRNYPTALFIMGLITNILFRFSWLFVPGIILSIIGIFINPCLYIGLALLLIDIAISLIEQIKIRQVFLKGSDDPDFQAFQDAVSKDGDWKDNIFDFLNQKMSDSQNQMDSDDESEDQ